MLSRCTKVLNLPRRYISNININIEDGIGMISLHREPGNCLNLELLKDISTALDTVQTCRGMILTSSLQNTFSNGLDPMEFYKIQPERGRQFWTTLQDVWIKLFGSDLITASAINGTAKAGGCLLALSTEYRSMVSGGIGFNEPAVGLFTPPWFIDTMCHIIPKRDAECALIEGKLLNADEAFKIGLIDHVAVDRNDAIISCKQFINKNVPSIPRSVTKQNIRRHIINRLVENREADVREFLKFFQNPKVQNGVERYLQNLK